MNKKIAEFKEKDSFTTPLLVKAVTKGVTQKGAPYLNLSFQDSSGCIEGKCWEVKPEIEEITKAGKVMEVTGEVLEYNKNLQLRINSLKELDPSSIQMSEFVIASQIPSEELKQKVKDAINSIQDPIYKKIIFEVFKEMGEEFFDYPAAAKIHHNFLGGLAEHTTGMVRLADVICGFYPQLNRDLLVSGALVHDIGKMIELSGPVTTEYTLEGKLIGHISIMQGKLMEISDKLGVQDAEQSILLRHMVLAHHGHYEYGSPVLPQLQEAEVLYLIDNLDARMNTLKQALEATKSGEFTQKLFALENRSFYKPKE